MSIRNACIRANGSGTFLVALIAMLGLLLSDASGQQVVFDSTAGRDVPPSMLGSHPMTPFSLDGAEIGATIERVAAPGDAGSEIAFDQPLMHIRDFRDFGSHGYAGDAYVLISRDTKVTITLPDNASAFAFYAGNANAHLKPAKIIARANDGSVSSLPLMVSGLRSARYFGFAASPGGLVRTITVESDMPGLIIGEFQIAYGK